MSGSWRGSPLAQVVELYDGRHIRELCAQWGRVAGEAPTHRRCRARRASWRPNCWTYRPDLDRRLRRAGCWRPVMTSGDSRQEAQGNARASMRTCVVGPRPRRQCASPPVPISRPDPSGSEPGLERAACQIWAARGLREPHGRQDSSSSGGWSRGSRPSWCIVSHSSASARVGLPSSRRTADRCRAIAPTRVAMPAAHEAGIGGVPSPCGGRPFGGLGRSSSSSSRTAGGTSSQVSSARRDPQS